MAVEIRLGRLTRCRRWCCRAGTAGAEEPEDHVPADQISVTACDEGSQYTMIDGIVTTSSASVGLATAGSQQV